MNKRKFGSHFIVFLTVLFFLLQSVGNVSLFGKDLAVQATELDNEINETVEEELDIKALEIPIEKESGTSATAAIENDEEKIISETTVDSTQSETAVEKEIATEEEATIEEEIAVEKETTTAEEAAIEEEAKQDTTSQIVNTECSTIAVAPVDESTASSDVVDQVTNPVTEDETTSTSLSEVIKETISSTRSTEIEEKDKVAADENQTKETTGTEKRQNRSLMYRMKDSETYNPDGLTVPTTIAAPAISYGNYPDVSFANDILMSRASSRRGDRANPPVIGQDHPSTPGEVMLFKQVEEIPGMVNTWDITLRMEAMNTSTTSDIVLVMDRSGSMRNNQRMVKAKEAAKNFVNSLLPGSGNTRIALISYANEVSINSNLTTNKNDLNNAIDSMISNGGTFTQAALKQAEALLVNSTATNKHIVLLSDGVPTYSYGFNSTQVRRAGYRTEYVSNGELPDGYTAGRYNVTGTSYNSSAYSYNSSVGDGWTMYYPVNNEYYNGRRSLYNHGNSAIAEAGFAKGSGKTLWSISLEAGTTGTQVLDKIASPGNSYIATPGNLNAIFSEIAGKIAHAAKNTVVNDPMGQGFEVTAGNISNISVTQGTYAYANNTINWNCGTLIEPISPGSDIVYAEMHYRVEINDNILDADHTGELYSTNGAATVSYTDINGAAQTANFPVPSVNPVLYTVEKVVLDKNGNDITNSVERIFDVNVVGINHDYNRTFAIDTTKYGSGRLMTDLRRAGTYSFSETAVNVGSLEDYDTTYYVNNVPVTDLQFTVPNNETEDMYVKVVNRERGETAVSVTKVWNDNDNQDGKRPQSITVKLLADGVDTQKRLVLNSGDNWTGAFTELPEYSNGELINYTVAETSLPTGYTSNVTGDATNGYTITNTYTPETVDIIGAKTWDDNNNQDGARPASITIRLLANGTEVDSKEVTAADQWEWSFTGKPKYLAGVWQSYTILEDAVEGYSTVIDGYNVTNKRTPDQTSVTVVKRWDDQNNVDGHRPQSATIKLFADNEDTGKSLTLNVANNWTGTFTGLAKNKAGQPIAYTVQEDEVHLYTTTITGSMTEGFVVTNSHTPHTIDIVGQKTWNDNDDQDGARPTSITVKLLQNGNEIDSKVVTEEDSWSWAFTDLYEYVGGIKANYAVSEDPVAEYSTEYQGYNIINTHTPGKVSVQVQKSWQDNYNQDGYQPNSVTVRLWKNGVQTDQSLVLTGPNWQGSFTDLDEFENGAKITYTVTEDEVNHYTTSITGNATDGYLITNIHIPETVNVAGVKTWDDNNNQDQKRPDKITIRLLRNGVNTQTKEITAADNWAWSFNNLPKKVNGTDIVYTISEDSVAEYSTTIDGYNVTNKRTPDKTSVRVTKSWFDNQDQDGKRPESVKIYLLADGVRTGQEVVLTATNNWTATFSELDVNKAGGVPIVYTVEEDPTGVTDRGYITSYTGSQTTGYTVVNTRTPETITVEGAKTWDDADNQEGVRPASITIRLYANGIQIRTATVTAEDEWKWAFEDLNKYEHGQLITYTVTEDTVDRYTTVVNGYNVTNSHRVGQKSVQVTKRWNDNDNQDGKRPTRVVVKLLADGEDTNKTVVLNASNNWSNTFVDLDEFKDGQTITYTVEEVPVAGYTANITGDAAQGYVIENTHQPEKVTIAGTKTWDDNDNQDGKRPTEITVNLLKNNQQFTSQIVSAAQDGSWTWSFADLDKYENGQEITYTVTEEVVADYTTTVNGYNIINTHTPGKTSVQVSKSWLDDNNRDGIRPNLVVVNLLADGEATGQTLVLTATNQWTGSFTDLDEYKGGEKIVYTVEEEAISSYVGVSSGDASQGFTLTNTHIPETISFDGEKIWNDNNNQDGKRPESVTVRIWNGATEVDHKVVTEETNWKYTFENLPKYENGETIRYRITEDAVADYTAEVEFPNVENTHTPGKTSVSVTKNWDDNDNQDGKRPASVIVTLVADSTETDQTITLNAANNWTASFTDLDEYKNGTKIVYTVKEETAPGYEAPVITTTATNSYTITNTRVPEKIEISGTKTWNDSDNVNNTRPESITIHLKKNGTEVQEKTVTASDNWTWTFTDLDKYENGAEINYTITEDVVTDYSTDVTGYNITNTLNGGKTSVQVTKSWQDNNNQDGLRPASITVTLLADGKSTNKTVALTENNNWTASFTDLEKYKAGKLIAYTIEELEVEGYQASISGTAEQGYVVTNAHTPIKIDVSGSKTWNDNNNQDGKRPEKITINLLKNGVVVATQDVTADDNWMWTFTNLDKYENGELITYTISEVALPEYSSTVNGYDVTNSHTPGKTSVQVTKNWEDNNDQDGIRPDSINVNLFADGQPTNMSITLNETNSWTASFTDLDEYKDGQKIVYTVKEAKTATGYNDPVVTGSAANGYIITNEHTPERIDITGKKTWDDNNNQDGKRPEEILVYLYSNGVQITKQLVTAADDWTWTFEDLDKYEAGELINYTISEESVENYTTSVHGYNVTNTHNPGKTSIQVNKTWQDDNNQDGIRPVNVVVNLLADGKKTDQSLILTATNHWTGTFTDLDLYKDGQLIQYTVEEEHTPGYTSAVTGTAEDGYVLVNSHTPLKINVSGKKIWKDHNDRDGKRPDSVTIRLLKNGKVIDQKIVTEADDWAWNFTDLDKYEEGQLINYTIAEVAQDNYSAEVNGYDVKNTYVPDRTSVQVTKAWQDGNDQDGIRPEAVTVKLLADGTDTGETIELNAKNNWTATFTDLLVLDNGKPIVYTVEEETVEGYSVVITGDAKAGFVLTNSHTVTKIDIPGKATWIDEDDKEGKRPDEIVIRLYENGEEIDQRVVTEDDDWTWNFPDLDKYKDGELIVYTISEDSIPEYSIEIDGYDVINTHVPGKTSIQVTKAWQDRGNMDGIRPTSVTVKLLADGKETGQTLLLSEANNWTGAFTDLDLYKEGELVKYEIQEQGVYGYTSVINGTPDSGYMITNVHEVKTYIQQRLPRTGGGSAVKYVFYGVMLLIASAVLYIIRKRYVKNNK